MITGTQNPVVGKDEIFQFSDGLDLFNSLNATYVWNIWKKKAGKWINITQKPPKIGKKVSFKFGEKVLGEEFKLEVFKATPKLFSEEFEAKPAGEFFLVPTSSKVPKIDKVILFNQGAKDPNKASYRDTLIAKAYCVAMFNKEVEFQLWEDDAAGPGHNVSINKNNQLPQTFKGRVNENGTAEVKISLLSNASILKAIANKYMMSGDKDEGANHEYYVTASYAGKIQKASQVNVDVANPDYKTKPKEDSPKFPSTTASKTKKQPDAKGNITDAYFVNDKNQKLASVLVGSPVKVQILSNNMVGKYIQYVVWEKDFGFHDEIYRSGRIKIPGDIATTGGFTITDTLFKKGIDSPIGDSDSDKQNYFIEIIVLDSTAESKNFGIDDKAGQPMEVVRSASMVKEVKVEKKKEEDNVCECEARVRAYMRMLRVGEGTGELIKSSVYNKKTKKNEIVYVTHDFEGGYTKLFGGGNFIKAPHYKDMSDHPQIKILFYTKKNGEKVYSSAAGAYQVMGYTWSDKSMIKNRKTYTVKDFSAESQDKFCIVLFKHKRAGMLEMIINGNIKEATETYGSYEWASLPPGRYGQPIETMDKALELYNTFYQEELRGKSPLHLKKGFLKDFGYDCCDEAPVKPVATTGCGKSEIDLRSKIAWQTQFDPKWGGRDRQMVACKKTCDDILINNGLTATSLASLYQTALENDKHTILNINTQVSKDAVSYLDSELEKGHPVQVGVDHGLGYKINNNADHTTDHFVVIVGRKCEGNKCYYIFYDVGTSHKEKGASDNNRLYFDKADYSLKGKTVYNGNFYTVTQIRKN
ncbi:glycoside hydrolase family 104 protein [Kaistella sp. G5-32]|uniref:Glycoside hydrolase family 104 protein n=1 Tax=Kaistella gelatinilytica TaxID=2787636 RepID=A0ABS0FFE5_9FLAO|nr:glycoside hydrolase family 104 protein [Kaistella gelatinilytica]MBF8458401.1 glycoside hydrolase family 104 protein [Kaistella gelatinilytica]